MAFGIVTWNPLEISTFNVFSTIWDYDGLPLADQTRTNGNRHVRVMIDDNKVAHFTKNLVLHGLTFKKI